MTNTSNETTVALIRSLIEHMKGAEDTWEQLSMVIYFSNGKFQGTYGYTYSPDGTISAVASHPREIKESVQAYLDTYFTAEDTLPVKLLVQFDRTLGQYEITFEDIDVERWKVSPANIDTIREELRPQFNA